MKVDRKLTPPASCYRDLFETSYSDVSIKTSDGEVKFQQSHVEHPSNWSENAVTIAASKYFYGNVGDESREHSVFDMVDRVVDEIVNWGKEQSYFDTDDDVENFRNELGFICLNQMALFNSPVWFNFGVPDGRARQASACFIQSVEDSMEGIMRLAHSEALVFKGGSGSGVNMSPLRSSYEPLTGGGYASGPVSFMKGFDSFAGVIQSGGRTRRAACMRLLDIDHPDVMETADGSPGFITCKVEEEKKARALMSQGYSGSFSDPLGAYSSLQFQNANHSVRLSDEFMGAVKRDDVFNTVTRTTGEIVHTYRARHMLEKIAEAAHACGEPGVQFSDTINSWNTVPNVGRINASNPCSELVFLDNVSCNLSSINLAKFMDDNGWFLTEKFQHVVQIMILAQDIMIDAASYPTRELADNSSKYRPLGLGYTNLHTLLMRNGLAYDSSEGRILASAITSLMTATAYEYSARLGDELGAFESFEYSAIQAVIDRHYSYSRHFSDLVDCGKAWQVYQIANDLWQKVHNALEAGGAVRNAQVTLLAPTGTISFVMDAQTTGIEPEISLVKWKHLVGGGTLKLVSPEAERALEVLGYDAQQIGVVLDYIKEHGTADGCDVLKEDHLPVFDCAYASGDSVRCIGYRAHLQMMGYVQPFLSGAISKTLSFPASATVQDIYDAIVEAHELGIKAVAFYRDGSRSQPVVTSGDSGSTKQSAEWPSATRRELPATRPSALIHKFVVGGQNHYLALGMFEDGQLGEIFLTASGGGTYDALLSNWAIAVSIALQYGVPLKDYVGQFKYKDFQPNGFTGNEDIPSVLSPIDYVARFLENYFFASGDEPECDEVESAVNMQGPPCTNCGNMTVRRGTCYYCNTCGDSSGCS